jgi:DNA/RNA-binding domain of Phe-tRNA-synthetase-like protein
LPRINGLTDLYNAISVLHQVPIGGEDLDHYRGAPRLVRATGDEPFETTAGSEPVIDHPQPGEVVWRDDAGVTCRIWNWRQCTRTQLTAQTTRALFILDALAPMPQADLIAAGEELVGALRATSPAAAIATRLLP